MNQAPTPFFAAVVFAVAVGLSLIGVRLLLRGLGHGQPLHGFDLTGNQQGNRLEVAPRVTRRLGMIARGVLLLCLSLTIGGGLVWMSIERVSPLPYEPFAWLMYCSTGNDPADRNRVIHELLLRYNQQRLSPTQRTQLLATALRSRGDVGQPWNIAWAEIIESEVAAGKLSASQWENYQEQTKFSTDVSTFDIVRGGEEAAALQLDFQCNPLRVASASNHRFYYEVSHVVATLDDLALDVHPPTKVFSPGEQSACLAPVLSQLKDGVHWLHVRAEISAMLNGRLTDLRIDQSLGVRLTTRTANQTLLHQPDAQHAVEQAIQATAIRLHQPGEAGNVRLILHIDASKLPVDVGFYVTTPQAHTGDTFGQFFCAAHSPPVDWLNDQSVRIPDDAETLDVVFSPCLLLRYPADPEHIVWDGGLIIKNVPVQNSALP